MPLMTWSCLGAASVEGPASEYMFKHGNLTHLVLRSLRFCLSRPVMLELQWVLQFCVCSIELTGYTEGCMVLELQKLFRALSQPVTTSLPPVILISVKKPDIWHLLPQQPIFFLLFVLFVFADAHALVAHAFAAAAADE